MHKGFEAAPSCVAQHPLQLVPGLFDGLRAACVDLRQSRHIGPLLLCGRLRNVNPALAFDRLHHGRQRLVRSVDDRQVVGANAKPRGSALRPCLEGRRRTDGIRLLQVLDFAVDLAEVDAEHLGVAGRWRGGRLRPHWQSEKACN